MKPITILTIVFTLTTFIACKDGGTTPETGNSPAYVLEVLEESFNKRDVSGVDGVVSDNFVFYFDTRDVGDYVDGYEIPKYWDREDFMKACANMLEQAYAVDFSVSTANLEDPEEGSTTYEAYNVQIKLLIMEDSINGFLASGFCDFELKNEGSAGYDDWKVSKWYDHTAPEGYVELSNMREGVSLGSIFARFY
jgi:hypothetical protein